MLQELLVICKVEANDIYDGSIPEITVLQFNANMAALLQYSDVCLKSQNICCEKSIFNLFIFISFETPVWQTVLFFFK